MLEARPFENLTSPRLNSRDLKKNQLRSQTKPEIIGIVDVEVPDEACGAQHNPSAPACGLVFVMAVP